MKKLLFVALLFLGCGQSMENPYIQGPPGEQGPPGTGITTVQFCPGTTQYPTIFPEYGLLINGNIYAVYSQNDGFLTLIPTGIYYSNAVGSSCTFTVNANGTITN